MRFAVLGCGSIGRRHLRNLQTFKPEDLVAFDPVPAVREGVTAEFGIKCFAQLDDIWEQNPDVVLVTAPSGIHVELSLAAAQHGCHLFIEKPLSHTLNGVENLIQTIKAHGLIAMVGCNMRFHPGPSTVKRLIDEGAVGDILAARVQTGSYLPEWRPGQDYRESYSSSAQHGGGALLDCIHEVDLALWYFGPGHLAGAATRPASSLGLEVEGLAELLIQHTNGVLASVHLNFVQRDYRRSCEVIGQEGTIYWNFSDSFVEVRKGKPIDQRYDLDSSWKTDQMYIDEMSYFIRAVERGEQTFCSAADGLAALEIVLAARDFGIQRAGNGR